MPKFLVRVGGENYGVRVLTRHWFFLRKEVIKRSGFITTRFVEAENANKAIEEIMTIVRAELESSGRTTTESTIELMEVREDSDAFDEFAPGAGFTFSIDD